MAYEQMQSTWEKRFMQRHYSYRDFHSATIGADPTATVASYAFGTNARAVSIYNWPMLADWVGALNTYARSIMILSPDQAVTVVITSVNPYYLILINQGKTAAEIAALGVSLTITEVATTIPANTLITFYPTYGYAITFYNLTTTGGTIYIWTEGNMEGNE